MTQSLPVRTGILKKLLSLSVKPGTKVRHSGAVTTSNRSEKLYAFWAGSFSYVIFNTGAFSFLSGSVSWFESASYIRRRYKTFCSPMSQKMFSKRHQNVFLYN